jgi:hypothetical protein
MVEGTVTDKSYNGVDLSWRKRDRRRVSRSACALAERQRRGSPFTAGRKRYGAWYRAVCDAN